MPRDFYDVLGVSRDASQEDIKRAYRRLSKELHPDKNDGGKDSEKKFKEVNEAYEVLSDEKKRKNYDQFGSTKGPFGGGQGPGGFDFSGGNFSGFGDIFESFFGGQQRGTHGAQRGRDLEVAIEVDFRDVVNGAEHKMRIEKEITCDVCKGKGAAEGSKTVSCAECGGTGQVTKTAQSFFGVIQQRTVCERCKGSGKVPEKPCSKCHGEGRKHGHDEIRVKIPAGIHDGQILNLRGWGGAGPAGTQAGHLYVHVRVRPDKRFTRDGDDIRTQVSLPVTDALLGTQISVETVHGKVTLKIPEGTQPGQVFRLKGKGLPVLGTSRHGDHYVTVNIEIPKKLSKAEKKLVEEWREKRD